MPPSHSTLPPPFLLFRRLFASSRPRSFAASCRTQDQSKSSAATHPNTDGNDSNSDFYSLLLSQPLADQSPTSITHRAALQPSTITPTSAPISAPTSTPLISFSMPLAGPSARMRGLARGERGLDRPPEPDNCCMSGCVNCVWEAYGEEVEEWARGKRRRERRDREVEEGRVRGMRAHADVRYVGRGPGDGDGEEARGGGVKGLDGGVDGSDGGEDLDYNDDDEEGLFDEVPVGTREFMATEKRLRERKQRRLAMGEG